MKTNGAADAFPSQIFYDEHLAGCSDGLTKREYFAALAMQGLLASRRWEFCQPDGFWENQGPPLRELAEFAAQAADSLIRELNGGQSDD